MGLRVRDCGCIRGVYPRGLIEGRSMLTTSPPPGSASASAGSTPAASLKAVLGTLTPKRLNASAGSTPAASLKAHGLLPPAALREQGASAGSTPAASLKDSGSPEADAANTSIRGVYPRGLIEGTVGRGFRLIAAAHAHPRGLPPRPH